MGATFVAGISPLLGFKTAEEINNFYQPPIVQELYELQSSSRNLEYMRDETSTLIEREFPAILSNHDRAIDDSYSETIPLILDAKKVVDEKISGLENNPVVRKYIHRKDIIRWGNGLSILPIIGMMIYTLRSFVRREDI